MKEILIFIHERINCLYNYFVNLILLIIKCWQSQLLFPLCRSSDLRTQLRTLILLHVTLSQYQAHNRTNQDWMKQQIKILLVECIIITKMKPDVLQVLVNSSPWPASRCHLLVMPTSAETQSAIAFNNKKTALRSSYSTFMQIMHISYIFKACIIEEFALISSIRHPKLPSLVRSSCMPHKRNVLLFKSIEKRPTLDRPKYIKWFGNEILTCQQSKFHCETIWYI